MNEFLEALVNDQGDTIDLEKSLLLIEKYIRDYEFREITKEDLVSKVLLLADEFNLDEFQSLLRHNQPIDIQLLLGLTWHYLDSL